MMSEGASEASAAKKRKLGQQIRPEYCIEFPCLMKSTWEYYAYCKYCKQDFSIQHGGWDLVVTIKENHLLVTLRLVCSTIMVKFYEKL